MNPEYLALPPARRRWYWPLLLIAVLFLEIALWQHLQQQKRVCQTTGVRFGTVITEDTLERVWSFVTSEENTQGISASFWGQESMTVSTQAGRKANSVIGIGYYGSAEDCLPVFYRQGGAPGVSGTGCALSEGLAQILFGSTDVVGMKVRAQRRNYTITGVFAAEDPIFLFPSEEQLTCAELRGVSWDAPKEDVEAWCTAAGLAPPECIVYGPQRIWILSVLCRLPLLTVGVAFCVSAIRWSFSWPKGLRETTWFALAVLVALMLPNVLEALPGWLIPGRWSNFKFWKDLTENIRDQQRAWALCARYWPDLFRR